MSGKVFIQRDYSSGTRCQFQTKFPAELENRVRTLSPHLLWGDGGGPPQGRHRARGVPGGEGRGGEARTRRLEEDE